MPASKGHVGAETAYRWPRHRVAVLPAAIDDAQLEGQEADRHLVRLVLIVAQVVAVSTGPLRSLDRAARKLVKRLAQELRADEAACTHWLLPLTSVTWAMP